MVLRELVRPRPHRRGRPLPRRGRRRPARAPHRGAGRQRARGHRRLRAAVRGHHQPGGGHRRRRRHGDPRRGGGGRHRVRAVPPHRAPPPGDAAAAAHRGAARSRRAAARRATASGSSTSCCSRDKVSRAITARMLEQDVEHLWLDATGLERFAERFPTIAAELAKVGLDPADGLAADRPGRPLQLRRDPRRPRRRVVAARPVGGRGGELQRRDGRQPAGVELAARRHGVRPPRGRGDRPRRRRARSRPARCGALLGGGEIGGRPHRRAAGRRDHRARPRRRCSAR